MQTWYTINLNPIATGEHYNVIGDFNCALFISKFCGYKSTKQLAQAEVKTSKQGEMPCFFN